MKQIENLILIVSQNHKSKNNQHAHIKNDFSFSNWEIEEKTICKIEFVQFLLWFLIYLKKKKKKK